MTTIQFRRPPEGLAHYEERVDLAASLHWTARLDMHEAVGNHFSLAVNEDGTKFLMNPGQVHFSLVRASDLLLVDANDPSTTELVDTIDPTAWGLHGTLHRQCPHARCAMHVHSTYATVLASLADSSLPAIDQNSAAFFNRIAIDEEYGGMAFEEEATRMCSKFSDPSKKVLIMGNHGVMVIGSDVAETFNRLYYFERAARNYILALSTGRPLRTLPDAIAEKTATEWEAYPESATKFLASIKQLLDAEANCFRE
jgi:ribulose-5-phosphate 4-epimerase/fuculose-1-phosphate aldolase